MSWAPRRMPRCFDTAARLTSGKCKAISPAGSPGCSRRRSRMARRVGCASASKRSLRFCKLWLRFDKLPQRLELAERPAAFESVESRGGRLASALEPVVEQLHDGSTLGRREAEGHERRRHPSVSEPVVFPGDLAGR